MELSLLNANPDMQIWLQFWHAIKAQKNATYMCLPNFN